MNANKYSILKEDSRLQHKLESKSINPPETTENIAKRPNYNILLGTTPLKPKQMPRAWRTFVIAMDQDSQRFRSFEKTIAILTSKSSMQLMAKISTSKNLLAMVLSPRNFRLPLSSRKELPAAPNPIDLCGAKASTKILAF